MFVVRSFEVVEAGLVRSFMLRLMFVLENLDDEDDGWNVCVYVLLGVFILMFLM